MNRQVHKWSPSLLSPPSVKQVDRSILLCTAMKSADLKFTVSARSNQPNIHTHALRYEVTLVWGSLRLAPISDLVLPHSTNQLLPLTLYQPMTAKAVMNSHKPIRIYMGAIILGFNTGFLLP